MRNCPNELMPTSVSCQHSWLGCERCRVLFTWCGIKDYHYNLNNWIYKTMTVKSRISSDWRHFDLRLGRGNYTRIRIGLHGPSVHITLNDSRCRDFMWSTTFLWRLVLLDALCNTDTSRVLFINVDQHVSVLRMSIAVPVTIFYIDINTLHGSQIFSHYVLRNTAWYNSALLLTPLKDL